MVKCRWLKSELDRYDANMKIKSFFITLQKVANIEMSKIFILNIMNYKVRKKEKMSI